MRPPAPLRRIIPVAVLLLTLGAGRSDAQAAPSPVGTWHTISDVTGKPRGVIEIREEKGEIIGTARGSLVAGEKNDMVCSKCPGDRKDKPIMGMDILRGLHADGDEWTGGEILDPDTGKTYKAKIRLEDGGKKLILRGYIGFSLIGRSQTWIRATP
jgi:uncharacterized protein (DUF2147 family)